MDECVKTLFIDHEIVKVEKDPKYHLVPTPLFTAGSELPTRPCHSEPHPAWS